MKKIYIIHGWGFDSNSYWIPKLAQQLEDIGFNVITPNMPDTENPTIDKWIGKLQEIVLDPDSETYFIGHSIGCQTILRYLESLDNNLKIGGILLVAPWIKIMGLEPEEEIIANPWLNNAINFEKVKIRTANIAAIFSETDPYVYKENEDILTKELNAKLYHIGDKKHITEIEDAEYIKNVFNSLI